MVATLPGRSVGIGLITEPLLGDLGIARVAFGEMNFWATVIGATFSLLCGPAIDRFGVRSVTAVVLSCLGILVLMFSNVAAAGFVMLLLIPMRGFGQSALSVTSLAIVGKWFVRRLSIAMAIFGVLISIGFAAAIVIGENTVLVAGWRSMWSNLGWLILVAAGLTVLFVRRDPESVGLTADHPEEGGNATDQTTVAVGATLKEALSTPAFWVLAIGSALCNMVISGVSLFNQSILSELGFDALVFRNAMAVFMSVGLAGNMLAGWLARKWSLGRLMSIAMTLMTCYLLTFPFLKAQSHVLLHVSMLGLAGGVVTVIFFAAWGQMFGRPHLGKIQGAAQVFTVFASASGPWLLASSLATTGTYQAAFNWITPAMVVLAVFAWFVRIPQHRTTA